MDIQVKASGEKNSSLSFDVTVKDKDTKSNYKVTLERNYLEEITGGVRSEENFIEDTFKFLLERESKEEILGAFDVSVIKKYFPEYEDFIKAKYN